MTGQISPAAIALDRFGLGARPDDRQPSDPPRFLRAQFERYQPDTPGFTELPDAGQLVQDYQEQQQKIRAMAPSRMECRG